MWLKRKRPMVDKPTHCRDCGAPITQVRCGVRLRCTPCKKRADYLIAKEWQRAQPVKPCKRCGAPVIGQGRRLYCPPCAIIVASESQLRSARKHRARMKADDLRQCRHCKEIKPLDNYPISLRNGSHSLYCRECDAAGWNEKKCEPMGLAAGDNPRWEYRLQEWRTF
jgi:hypothetical protein